jgi:DNA-binding response OmpR family regulator
MKKILVVDDELDILSIIKIILERKNFLVSTISNWQQIASTIKIFMPDLILLDISLRGADGRDICKQLKTDKETEGIRIILFSANFGVEKTLEEVRADGFIAKPFEPAHLVNTIQMAL